LYGDYDAAIAQLEIALKQKPTPYDRAKMKARRKQLEAEHEKAEEEL